MENEENDNTEKCWCGDSIRTAIGSCPPKGHREYSFCPKRKGLFNVEGVQS